MHRLLLVIALVAYSSGCIAEEREGLQPLIEKQEINDRLLEIASQEPEVDSFIAENPDYNHETTVLNQEDVTRLSKKYPVIYGNLPNKTLYKIDYKNDRGMLVIVDLENKEVLRYFRTTGVSLE